VQVARLEDRVHKDAEWRRALLHIASDLHDTNKRLADQRKAMLHILVDYEQDRRRLARQTERLDKTRRALLHILQDVHQANQRLQNSRTAMIHIMGDLRDTEAALRSAHDELDQRVRERTAELMHANERLRREIAERQQAEAQVLQQQEKLFQHEKLAAMGTLLANVAHELNNPLAIILMQADLLREDAGSGPLAETAAEITQAATRCERLVRTFLTLARQHAPERTAVDLNALITGTLELLTQLLRIDNIAIELCLAGDLPQLWVDPYQLQQVLVNLLTNAQQALREAALPRQVTLTTWCDPARTQVTLQVADSGPGMPPAIQARIFEPFFTTKALGVGTGLGLPLCQGIIESHGGSISVTSAPGQGATFRVELPVGGRPETTSSPPDSDGARSTVPSTAILLVDDEPGITKALARLLHREGHRVDTAANGRLALAKLRERPYDLILSDLRMPELDGPGLYRALEQHAPPLCRRFIFLTGDTLSPETLAFFAQSGVPRLTKPFTVADLRHIMRQVLQAE
jgi:C4-dicarboxylate-specific signal transduction histidine kinase/CheY-like chemotaxis protein